MRAMRIASSAVWQPAVFGKIRYRFQSDVVEHGTARRIVEVYPPQGDGNQIRAGRGKC